MSQAEGMPKSKVLRGDRPVALQHLLKMLMQEVQERQCTHEDRMGWGWQGSAGLPGSKEEGGLCPESTGEPWVDLEQR